MKQCGFSKVVGRRLVTLVKSKPSAQIFLSNCRKFHSSYSVVRYPANIYFFKVNYRNTRKRYEIVQS